MVPHPPSAGPQSYYAVDGHMEPLDKDNGEKGVRSAHTQSKVKALGDDLPGEHNGGHMAGTQFHGLDC